MESSKVTRGNVRDGLGWRVNVRKYFRRGHCQRRGSGACGSRAKARFVGSCVGRAEPTVSLSGSSEKDGEALQGDGSGGGCSRGPHPTPGLDSIVSRGGAGRPGRWLGL